MEPEPVAGSGDEKDDEDLDGIPLDGAALLKSAIMRGIPGAPTNDSPLRESAVAQAGSQQSNYSYDDDIDGIPRNIKYIAFYLSPQWIVNCSFLHSWTPIVDEDIDGIPLDKNDVSNTIGGGFIPSKWETVDPDQVEAQAITTSKWDTLEPVVPEPPAISTVSDDSFDSFDNSESNRDFDEEKRIKLREIELKTIQYQDELESGQRSLKSGWSLQQQVEHYRRKLMKKTYKEMQDSPMSSAGRERDSRSQTSLKRSPSPMDISKRAKKSKRSPSPSHPRSMRRKSISPPKSSRPSKRDKMRSRSRSRSPSSSYSMSPKRYR